MCCLFSPWLSLGCLSVAEILMRWKHRPVHLEVDWPTLLMYGLPSLILTDIVLVWFLFRLPLVLSGKH